MAQRKISPLGTIKVTAKLPLDLVQHIDLLAAQVRAAHGRTFSRAAALRHLLAIAVGQRERKAVVSPQRPWRE